MDQKEIYALQQCVALLADQPAFKRLFNFFSPLLIRFAWSLIKNKGAAEEIIDDIFIRLWEQKNRLLEVDNLKVYLYKATRNQCLNYLKKRKLSEDPLDTAEVQLMKFDIDPEQLMITAEMMKRMEQAVENLPPRCKLIFQLIREQGFRNKDAAQILGISINTVDVQLAIAIKRISHAINFDTSRKQGIKKVER
jgi:RNA polymerase sigma-70 factor (ECF subfamily)